MIILSLLLLLVAQKSIAFNSPSVHNRHRHPSLLSSSSSSSLHYGVKVVVPSSTNSKTLLQPSSSSSLLTTTTTTSTTTSLSTTRKLHSHHSFTSSKKPSTTSRNLSSSDATEKQEGGGGTATISNEIFNLVKNIVGAGVLSLPAGIAAFGNTPTAVIPSLVLIASIGTISAYGFSLIGRVCSMTGATSYRDAWSKSIGSKSSWIPAVSCTCKTIFAVLAYSMILADTSQQLLVDLAGYHLTRTQSLLGLTSFILLPLCLMKNLSSLAPFSLLGSLGMCYTAIAMVIRYVGNSYKIPTGKFLPNVVKELQPKFGSSVGMGSILSNPNIFILISMLSTAYMAHFNAPKFYTELKNNTIKRYNTVVASSFGISIALFGIIAAMGFLTFGSASSGVILSNYASTDKLISLSKIAVAISLIFSYPLAFVGVREGVLDLFNVKDRSNYKKLNILTVSLLSMVTSAALVIKDVRFVLAFAGATLGNALIYIYPALMFKSTIQNVKKDKATNNQKKEVKVALGSATLGLFMGLIGAIMAIKAV